MGSARLSAIVTPGTSRPNTSASITSTLSRPQSRGPDLYRDCLPLLNSKKADLLNNIKMVNQFISFERRTAWSGRDSIDHMPDAHDDLANATVGALCNLSVKAYKYDSSLEWVDGGKEEEPSDWRMSQLRYAVDVRRQRRTETLK
jgi:hypothetical protein